MHVGDLVQLQVWDGVQCELARQKCRIVNETRQKGMKKVTNCQSIFCLKEIHSLHVASNINAAEAGGEVGFESPS